MRGRRSLRASGMLCCAMSECDLIAVTEANAALAVALLVRFFREEGFATPADRIAANLQHMLKHGTCWSALAMRNEGAVGVITVTTMLYVEWGRLGEIGDLYVLPEHR